MPITYPHDLEEIYIFMYKAFWEFEWEVYEFLVERNGIKKNPKFLTAIVINQKRIFKIGYLRGSHIEILFRNMGVSIRRK